MKASFKWGMVGSVAGLGAAALLGIPLLGLPAMLVMSGGGLAGTLIGASKSKSKTAEPPVEAKAAAHDRAAAPNQPTPGGPSQAQAQSQGPAPAPSAAGAAAAPEQERMLPGPHPGDARHPMSAPPALS